jgi:hypothetical protein
MKITTACLTSDKKWVIAGSDNGLIFGGRYAKVSEICKDPYFTFDTGANAPTKKIIVNHDDSKMVIVFDHAFFVYSIETRECLWSYFIGNNSLDRIYITPDKRNLIYKSDIGNSEFVYEKFSLDDSDSESTSFEQDKIKSINFLCLNDDGSKILIYNSDGLFETLETVKNNDPEFCNIDELRNEFKQHLQI